jgi:ATP-binding cassette subfamily B protein
VNALRRYARLLRPYASSYVWGLGLLLLTNALSLLVPRLIKAGIDGLAGETGGDQVPDAFSAWLADPLRLCALLAGLALVLAVVRTGSRVLVLGVGRTLHRDLRRRLYDRLLAAAPSYYARFPTGEIMSRCISDARILQAVAAPGMLYTFNALFMFGIAVPYLLSVDARLTLYLLLPYPLLAALTMILATRVKRFAAQAQEAMADLTTRIQEALSGMEVVRAFTLQERQARLFAETNAGYLNKRIKEDMVRGGVGVASALTGGISTGIILWFGGQAVARGELTLGDLALFLTLMAMILRPTIFLGWVLSLLQRGLASLDRIDALLDEPLGIASPAQPTKSGPLEGRLEAKGLTYRYPSSLETQRRLALEDVSFQVPAGGVLGLVGKIGSGKSTVLRALPRLIEATEGQVAVDGAPVTEWDLFALRHGMGYVPQDGYVFSMTLGENVAFGRPDASEAEILEALEIAGLSQDLDQLDKGLATEIGERGVTLSGGQRQRLAIARAVLIQPKVLLLDDALSMVDAETTVRILEHLRERLADTTLVIAAHRTATLLGCDELLVLEQGVVIERGSPQELLGQDDSWFASMHERQRLTEQLTEELETS